MVSQITLRNAHLLLAVKTAGLLDRLDIQPQTMGLFEVMVVWSILKPLHIWASQMGLYFIPYRTLGRYLICHRWRENCVSICNSAVCKFWTLSDCKVLNRLVGAWVYIICLSSLSLTTCCGITTLFSPPGTGRKFMNDCWSD